ncbi:MAG: hypothetical protein NTY19_17445 [Planctomycetota bacterium]|nr:hypothetical protein [Planctomycetota bacterium]
MKLVHAAVCGALVAALEVSAASGAEVRPSGADDLWQIPIAPVSPRDTALGNTTPDLRRESADAPRFGGNPVLGRRFLSAPNDGPSAGTTAAPTAPASGSVGKLPQPNWNQRIATWRLARIEKVRGQLLQQTSGVRPADSAGRLDPPTPSSSPARVSQVEAPQPPQVLYGAPANRAAPTPANGPPLAAPKANEPSHEVFIELPDETEGPKPKGSLTNRLRGGR